MPRSAVFCPLRCLVSQNLFRKAAPALLAACVAAPSLAAQAIPTVSFLTVTSYTQPYSLSCSVYGTSVTGVAGPTGNVTFTDVTTGQNLGSAPLGTPAAAGFMPQVDSPLGFANGYSLARGDFNGDGKLDLIAGGYQQVSVLLNNGDGTYQAPKLAYVSGQHVIDMAVGDFNGDNKLDVIVLDDSAAYFVAGNGDGTFQPATFIAAGPYSSLVAGDFRGNGKLDIVLSSLSGSGVIMRLGNGDGTFQAPQTFAAPFGVGQVIAADFNNDQHLDLAIIGRDDSVSILLGAGTGSFDAPRTYPGIPATSLSAVDYDGDGKLDLAIDVGGNDDKDTISIMKGEGDGEFQSPIVVVISKMTRYGVPAHHFGHIAADSVLFPDLTAGRIDLGGAALDFTPDTDLQGYWNTPRLVHGSDGLVAYASGDEYVVFSNPAVAANAAVSSFITVQPPATHTLQCSYPGDSNYAASTGGTSVTLPAAAAPSIAPAGGAYGAPFNATISDATPGGGVIINYTTDGSTPTTSSPQYTGPIPITSTTTLQAIASSPNYVPSAVVTAAYTFEPIAAAPVISPTGGAYKSSSSTIQVTITGPPGATIYYSTSGIPPTTNSPQYHGPFTISTGASPGGPGFAAAIVQAIAVVPGQINSPIASAVYELNRTLAIGASFQCTFTGLSAFGAYPTGSVTFTDLTTGESAGSAFLTPSNQRWDPQVFSIMPGSRGSYLVAGDFNGDKKPDIVNSDSGGISVLLGNGDGTLQLPIAVVGSVPGSVITGDINGDGNLDLISQGRTGFLTILGNGDGTFQAPVDHDLSPLGNGFDSIAAGDFGNGHLDLVISIRGGIYVLLGNGDGTFQNSVQMASGASGGPVVAADFNGDNKVDLAFFSSNYTALSVMLGNGDGTFQAPQSSPQAADFTGFPRVLLAGDFNRDGHTDLLAAVNGVDEWLGNGDGTFREQSVVRLDTSVNSMVTGDFFHRGITDIALTQGTGQYSYPLIWVGQGDGTFYQGSGVQPRNAPTQVYGLVSGDFNGDGYSDLAFGAAGSSGAALQLATGTAAVSSTAVLDPWPSLSGPPATRIYQCSYDGDANYQGGTTQFSYTFSTLPPPQFSPPAGTYSPGQAVTITDANTSAAIYYTTDGSAPTTSSTRYTAPVALSGNPTLKAIAVAPGYIDSGVATAAYTSGAATKTSLSSSATSVAGGQKFTLTATVTGVSPTGSVTFTAGSTTLGKVTLAGGTASLQASIAAAGTYTVIATYSGDANNGQSISNAVNVVVTTTLVPVIVTPYWTKITTLQQYEDPVTIKVDAPQGAPWPRGTVTLVTDGWTSQPENIIGTTTIYIRPGTLTSGAHVLTATYSGDSIYAPAAGTATVVLDIPLATVTATPEFATITSQQSDTVAITVAGPQGAATPTGTVTLSGGEWVGQAALSSGVASILIPAGALHYVNNSMYAAYSGDSNYPPAHATTTITVTQGTGSTTTALGSSATAVIVGQQITLTAVVTGSSPTGSVTFKAGLTTLGQASVSGGTATLQTSFSAAGTYSVTATYSGDANNAQSTSNAVNIVVNPASSSTALTSSSASVNIGQPFTLTATVTGSSPTGSVTFEAGQTLGKVDLINGIATLQASFASAGSYSVTAAYSGDANNTASTSSAVSINVGAPAIDPGTPPPPKSVPPGGTATYPLTFSAQGGYTGTISLSCTGLPAQSTCSFNPATLTLTGSGSQSSTLSIVTTAPSSALAAPAGRPGEPLRAPLFFAGLAGLLFGLSRMRRFSARLRGVACVLLLAGAAIFAAGCGGGGSNSGGTGNAGTPAGTYTVTVTAQDSTNNVKQTLTVTLTVQ